jgi:uncharacterized radical SAM superfamily Fe-S cluster-containing enzyme
MTALPAETDSLCPHCLRRVPALRTIDNDAVYLKKSCPEHGDLEDVLLWKNYPMSYDAWRRPPASVSSPAQRDGCPYECGLCSNHKQATCSVILEVTRQCNIRCPICFASSESGSDANPDLGRIESMLKAVQDSAGCSCPIQLSGGEPTLRNDLPAIIALARKVGFNHIQVNTNGIRLAQDVDFGQSLLDAGATNFFLQFDGVTNNVYRRIRGAELWALKLKAIERCAELKIGVILVPALVRDVNENQIGAIIQFAKKWMPTVKGVHFQPMTYLGRYPNPPANEDRILIPDILAAIEEQTMGELRAENFIPPG